MLELNKEYTLKSGDKILITGYSMYQETNGKPVDIFTAEGKSGAWNKEGRYLPSVIFTPGQKSEMDILI